MSELQSDKVWAREALEKFAYRYRVLELASRRLLGKTEAAAAISAGTRHADMAWDAVVAYAHNTEVSQEELRSIVWTALAAEIGGIP